MKEELTLGQKLKFFRKQKGLSQSQLEIEADLAFGTISRIENRQINPTKETIIKIVQSLGLQENDLTYLLELRNSSPSEAEIESMIEQLQPVLDQEIFPSYIMDNRFRIWASNKMFLEIFEVSEEEAQKYKGINILQGTFLLKVLSRIPTKHLIPVLKDQIAIFKEETERFHQEEYSQSLLSDLKKNSLFNKLWKEQLQYRQTFRRAKYYLKYKGKILNILITRSTVPIDERFTFIEYFPQDKPTAEIFEEIRE